VILASYEQFWKKVFDYTSKCTRKEFLEVQIVTFFIFFILSICLGVLEAGESAIIAPVLSFFVLIAALAHVPPSISLVVRRFVDIGANKWYALLIVVPWVGLLVGVLCLILPSKKSNS